MTVNMYAPENYAVLREEVVLLVGCYCFLIISFIFLLNLLIAQLCCSYDAIYVDMVGYARLKRIRIISDSMPSVSPKRWSSFVDSLELGKRVEFNEGDVGLAGGIQVLEPASQNPTTVDIIRRFGGTTNPTVKWPEEESQGDDDSDKFGRIEDLIKKLGEQAMQASAAATKRGPKGGASSSGQSGGGAAGGGSAEAAGEEIVEEGAEEEVAE